MLICIDSCVFIRGLRDPLSDANRLLELLDSSMQLVIPRLIAVEVKRNLQTVDRGRFYRLFYEHPFARIIEEDIPDGLLQDYMARGLRAKDDAYIGAFAELMAVDFLISDNRHFLRELRTTAYQLASPGEFLEQLQRKAGS